MTSHRETKKRVLGDAALSAVVSVILIIGAIGFGLATALRAHAQSVRTADAPPSFEVASIKLDQSGTNGRLFQFPDPGRFNTLNMPAKDLVEFAYNIKPFQVSGGPSWIESQGYDIEAKVEDSLVPDLQKLPFDRRIDQVRLMLRSLLAERFKLSLSHETKELPVYALVVAKGGPKLTPTTFTPPDPNAPKASTLAANRPQLMMGPGKIRAVAQSMSGLADLLAREPDLGGRLVLDQTGIKGNYDFEVQFSQENPFPNAIPVAGDAVPSDKSGPSIFTAIQDQLGLRLEPTKGAVEIYTIEHIGEPSEN